MFRVRDISKLLYQVCMTFWFICPPVEYLFVGQAILSLQPELASVPME